MRPPCLDLAFVRQASPQVLVLDPRLVAGAVGTKAWVLGQAHLHVYSGPRMPCLYLQ